MLTHMLPTPGILLDSESLWQASQTYLDDIRLIFGTSGDSSILNRSTTLSANTALASVFVGTPVVPALAANTLIISNITQNGDIVIAGNRNGNSEGYFVADVSAGTLLLKSAGTMTISPNNQLLITAGADIRLTPTTNVVFVAGSLDLLESVDSAAVADTVSISRYDIGASNTVLAISQETAVATETDETKFSHKMQVRLNGATYFLMLTDS